MKTMSLILALAVTGTLAWSQPNFEAAMGSALADFGKAQSLEDMKTSAARFERIAAAEPEEWLPGYYSSMIYCLLAFKTMDVKEKQNYIDLAQKQIDAALKITDKESELHTMQGMIYQAVIGLDPMNNGALYSGKASGCFGLARKLDPKNPRPVYLEGLSVLNTPEQFGGGKTAALPLLEKAAGLFKNFEPKSEIYPNWGKEDCEKQLLACKPE
ncbi:MAG: hypothetical protein JXJ22_06055 [Bacteroidales bacterium]|nr:hypothetical protein [Bacteroidales bacterium]